MLTDLEMKTAISLFQTSDIFLREMLMLQETFGKDM